MAFLRLFFWVALFLVSTFLFTVLFQYGASGYPENVKTEWGSLVKFYHAKVDGKGAKDEKATPAP